MIASNYIPELLIFTTHWCTYHTRRDVINQSQFKGRERSIKKKGQKTDQRTDRVDFRGRSGVVDGAWPSHRQLARCSFTSRLGLSYSLAGNFDLFFSNVAFEKWPRTRRFRANWVNISPFILFFVFWRVLL